MLGIFIIAAIAIAIFLGAKTKINTGLFCMVFAYIIGCFVMGLKPKEIIGFWPTSTMFVILSVSLFYNIAAVNGTLEKMSGSLLYTCRKFPGLLPYALLAVAIILSVMGATYFTVLAFLGNRHIQDRNADFPARSSVLCNSGHDRALWIQIQPQHRPGSRV